MLDLAIHHGEGAITLADISEAQGISLSYLEQLFARLRIDAIGEGVDVTLCGGKTDCQEGERCLTHELWQQLGGRIHEFLEGVTLTSFLERENVSAVVRRQQNRVPVEAPRLRKTVA
jgi:Rrf2 family iron-sulfur cluster assembly transcriptional regulator